MNLHKKLTRRLVRMLQTW